MSEFASEITPEHWMLSNRLDFSVWIKNEFKYKQTSANNKQTLFNHQRFVRDFMQPDSPYRGILLYHALGTGKTRSAIAIAEVLSTGDLPLRAHVMSSAALEKNFVGEIEMAAGFIYNPLAPRWSFSPKTTAKADTSALCKLLRCDDDVLLNIIKTNKGIWIPKTGKPNFASLENDEQLQIRVQIRKLINTRYNFIHYNGLRMDSARNMLKTNLFDNSIVIIDEVHNFISRYMSSATTRHVYKALLNAKNMKLVLLSGTPLINKPVEVAHLANLLHGNTIMYTWTTKATMSTKAEKALLEFLSENYYVDTYLVKDRSLRLTLVPEGFGFMDGEKKHLVSRLEEPATIKEMIAEIEEYLIENNIVSKSVVMKTESSLLFPVKADEFDELFIDYENFKVTNKTLFSRRMHGLVSFNGDYDEADYPRVNEMKYVHLKMTSEQYLKYKEQREIEIELERKAKQRRAKQGNSSGEGKHNMLNDGNVYRAFTRAVCNFAFPQKINRPYPSTMHTMQKEMDLEDYELDKLDEDEDNIEVEDEVEVTTQKTSSRAAKTDGASVGRANKSRQYAAALKEARASLTPYLTKENIGAYSPKYVAILANIKKSAGPVLVYSFFKNVEGMELFTSVMQNYGYAELKVIKHKNGKYELDFTKGKKHYIRFTSAQSERDTMEILKNIYNSDWQGLPETILTQLTDLGFDPEDEERNKHGAVAQVFLITRSGSEGISLKCVRQVHIMEPYWNDICRQQVIGRAVRAKSHVSLPLEERVVDTFMYVMEFNDKQKSEQKQRMDMDTSDEYMLAIAKRKANINEGILDIMKEVSIDCVLSKKSRTCFKPTKITGHSRVFDDLVLTERDVKNSNVEKMKVLSKKTIKLYIVQYEGVSWRVNKTTFEAFTEEDLQAVNPKPSGHMIIDENTKKPKILKK